MIETDACDTRLHLDELVQQIDQGTAEDEYVADDAWSQNMLVIWKYIFLERRIKLQWMVSEEIPFPTKQAHVEEESDNG